METSYSESKEPSVIEYTPSIYAERWTMLLLFCSLEGANALLWISFAPISDQVQNYFGGGVYSSVTAVNMLANVFLIFYGPGTVLAALSMKKYGLRNSLLLGGFVTMLGYEGCPFKLYRSIGMNLQLTNVFQPFYCMAFSVTHYTSQKKA